MSYRASRAAAVGVSSQVDVSVVNCGDALQKRDKLHHGGLGSGGRVSKRNQVHELIHCGGFKFHNQISFGARWTFGYRFCLSMYLKVSTRPLLNVHVFIYE